MASSDPELSVATLAADKHGSRVSFVTMGLVVAVAVNVALGIGIVVATHLKSDAIAAEIVEDETLFQCRWMEQGRFVQVEVAAESWQAAESSVCGQDYRDVRLPPLLHRGLTTLLDEPGANPVLQAQRESCSCSEGQMPPVLQDILIEAPRLGTQQKKHALPRIVNNPEKKELNAVNPDIEPKPEPEPEKKQDEPEPEKKKKVHKAPNLDELLTAELKDEARPENQEKQTGTEWGSRHSNSDGAGPEYLQKVKARLDNSMQAPSSIPRTELSKLTGKVTIKVGANGRLWDWSWRDRSGNTAFDTMIERTLKRFEIGGDLSFPAPPDDWVMKPIRISIDGSKVR